jgi:queuine/archaeosine tRNA-ribosyltransferase
MNVYFAGLGANDDRIDFLVDFGARRLMLTFAYHEMYDGRINIFRDIGFDLMLDSGGFTAMTLGKNINLDDYCSYIKKTGISKYIVLDVIGDEKETMKNLIKMEKKRLNPIPVYHLGQDICVLETLCMNYDYVCLGGTVGSSRSKRFDFFSTVFENFDNKKFHGLGVNDLPLLESFNFYSVDSTSWLIAAKFNKIFSKNGKQKQAPENMTLRENGKHHWRNVKF